MLNMDFKINKKLYWPGGILLAVAGFLFAEGSLAASAKLLGPVKATLLRILFTIPLSWLVIYLSKGAGNPHFMKWFSEKEKKLSKTARLALNGGKAFAVLNTAVFLGPIIATVLMLMLGVGIKRLYLYSALCAVLCASTWCVFYSCVFWGCEKMVVLWR